MRKLNVEFKARVDDLDAVRDRLRILNPREVGLDRQLDTYFEVPEGRLKLREGAIERSLIFYKRSNDPQTRESHVVYAELDNTEELRRVLEAALRVIGVVDKQREIYFLGDTKIHLDRVAGHGVFVEVEAPSAAEADRLFKYFALTTGSIEGRSYSDFALKPMNTVQNNLP